MRHLLAAMLFAATVRAQAPAGADRLGAHAVTESLAVVRTLQERVTREYHDAASWYHLGMIAWALNERCRHVPRLATLDCTRTRMLADTSLMIAGELDPGNATYTLAFNQFLLTSEATFRREAPYLDRLFRASLERLRHTADPIKHADGAIDAGRLYWLRYDAEAHRDWETATVLDVVALARKLTPDSLKLDGDPDSYTRLAAVKARDALDAKKETPGSGFLGEADYVRAEALFREALAAAPDYLRAYRSYAILVAERNRWPELRSLAASRLAIVPGDGWAWMTLGLAYYRLGETPSAASAFGSAQLAISTTDRERLFRLERVLGANERAAYVHDHERFEATYWAMADPLWSRNDADPRLEFLARVSYAELLWSNDELSLHGVDSDRGATYIRAGPPDRISSYRDDRVGRTQPGGTPFGSIYWEYDCLKPPAECRYRFNRIPKYQTPTFANEAVMVSGPPASWRNLVVGRIDSIPAQVARFRVASDSVDVYFATLPPIAAIHRASEVAGPVRTDFWLRTERLQPVAHDSVLSSEPGLGAFTERVAPGIYIYSAEATGEASLLAARARARIVAANDGVGLFTLRGFGMSDVLLATRAESRIPVPVRWTELDAQPLLRPLHRNEQLALVWETYGLAPANGEARYDVVIAMQPDRPPRPGARRSSGIAARIVGGLAGALGVKRDVVDDRVEFLFARTLPYRETVVDNIAISVGNTPPGVYRVTVTVTDRVNGASTFSVRRITIIP